MRSIPCALALIGGVLSCLGIAEAQITIITRVGDKEVVCEHSGLTSDLRGCDVRSDWYSYVFVGSIRAIASVENDEKELQVVPEEVFHGNPGSSLTVLTSQAACLPALAIGDRWLFFLREQTGKPMVLDYYGTDSRPVANAKEEIETLRRLENIGDLGILRGEVRRGNAWEGTAVPDVNVIARRLSDNTQFFAKTGADGRYEFQPLPPGRYKITADRIGSFQADDSGIDLSRGACRDVALSRSPHARLAGHVRRSDGSPVAKANIVVMSADASWFNTSQTDEDGDFTFDSLPPDEYVVGINPPGAPAWVHSAGAGAGLSIPAASVYYPGVADRSAALVIKLAVDEERDDLDFIIREK